MTSTTVRRSSSPSTGLRSRIRGGIELEKEEVIRALGLQPLPDEGGYFRETYRSPLKFVDRNASTAIYYFLGAGDYSALHRLKSDEIYHFYRGDPVEVFLVDEQRGLETRVLGSCFEQGQLPQLVVPAGVWQASRVTEGGRWALMGTTVTPGFSFEDFELADESLIERIEKAAEKLKPLLRS